MKTIILMIATLLFVSCSHQKMQGHKDHYLLKKSVSSERRSTENKERDVYRHPTQTLQFFGIKPEMTVVEISPGGGWYSEILANYLEKGRLYLAIFDDNSTVSYRPKLNKKIREKMASLPSTTHISYSLFDAPNKIGPVAPPASADAVLTFRNLHNWMDKEKSIEKAFKEFHKALKPGGILGIVEHRTRSNKKQDPNAKSGYMREDYVIEMVEAAGFEFVAKSEINANELDSAEHPKGVWTLPPSLSLQEKDRAKYLAIGESDRMTLKFRKK